MTQTKLTLLTTLAASTLLFAGCTTTSKVGNSASGGNTNVADTNATANTNVVVANTNTANTNSANTVVVTNDNSNDNVNTNVDQGNIAGWNTFNIDQLHISINLPFESDQVSFREQTCSPNEGCDYEGYALFGTYTLTSQQPTGFLGSVSEQWSPSRDGNLFEIYDFQEKNGTYIVFRGNGHQSDNLNLLSGFKIKGHDVGVFDIDNTNEPIENYIYNDYLGVIKLDDKDKYRAFAISFSKDDITMNEFMKIMHSIIFL